jgi:hypothetical protein
MTGDVIAGIGNGQYAVYDNDGNFILTLDDGMGGFTTGAFYDTGTDLLYTTNFSNTTIVVYDGLDPHGIVDTIPTSPFGGSQCESIVFDANGDFYVGHAQGDHDIKKFTSAGVFLASFDVATETVGSDWIDLAADQKTMFYTSEGRRIMRYDVDADAQLGDFTLLAGAGQAFALRLLPPFDGTGGLIVADRVNVKRLDGAGNVAQTYDVAGEDNWFAMNLDPNGTSLWAGDFGTDNFYRFNIATGLVEVGPINTGGGFNLFGLAVVGEITGGVNCFTIDFDTDDSGTPMVHGTKVDDEFDGDGVFPVLIGSLNNSGLNTAAILDSDTGPAAQDPDLLVGSGNILILQADANTTECPPNSGIYCSHNDDADGGTLTFTWVGRLVSPRSVALIDIDSTDGTSTVRLTDEAGAQRTYTVPANWTGDLVDDATSGRGVLSLTTLADQAGFGSTATATEDAGFDPDGVVEIEIDLAGSGGVDDLVFCVPSAALVRASAEPRQGSGVNRARLENAVPPVVGTTWAADLDCRAFGSGIAILTICTQPNPGTMSRFGERLITGGLVHQTSLPFSSNVRQLTWSIPRVAALVGVTVHAQGLCRSTTVTLGSRSRVYGGLSNAVDLTLGF